MSNKHTILIVEEHERTRLTISEILSKEEGYEVLLADDVEAALEILKKNKVNVILSGLAKPRRLDGLKLLKASKLIKPRVRVILCMPFESRKKIAEAKKKGAYDVLFRPVNIEEMKITIKQAIEIQVTVLIVDDDVIRLECSETLSKEGYGVLMAEDVEAALEILKKNKVNVILADINMPGLLRLKPSKLIRPEGPVVILTGSQGTVEKAIEMMKNDACYDYLKKPFNITAIREVIEGVIKIQALHVELKYLREQLVLHEQAVDSNHDRVEENGVFMPIGTKLEKMEKELINKTLSHIGGNRTEVARMLGISERTLCRKIDKYGLK